jgi:hypothetical protein
VVCPEATRDDGEDTERQGAIMGLHERHADRLALAVAAGVTAILAREAEARQIALDRRLQPMRDVIDALERLHGPDAQPLEHPRDFANLVARHGAVHLRERDVQLLQAAMIESADRDCALSEALDDLGAARDASGEAGRQDDERSLLAWVGVSREQFLAAVETALGHSPPPA